jgi:cytoskeletal protein RodZ
VGQFGEELRRERESRGIRLEAISGSTKIITRYLSALENEQFDVLPGGILSKGIMRGYVRAVGLDERTWVERFLAASHQKGVEVEDEGWTEFVRNVGKTRSSARIRHEVRMRWAGVVVLLLLLGGFGWFVWRYVNTRTTASVQSSHSITSAAVVVPHDDSSQ